jgi:hypothetical protein
MPGHPPALVGDGRMSVMTDGICTCNVGWVNVASTPIFARCGVSRGTRY